MVGGGMTVELARRWSASERRRWPRWALVAAGVAAFAVSVASDTAPCSPTDPTVCGPDLTFSVAIAFAFAAVVLVWWWPLVAAACAVVFAVLDVLYDPLVEANIAWSVLAVLHVTHAVVLLQERQRRRELVEAASEDLPLGLAPVRRSAAHVAPGRWHLAVVGLVVVAVVCLGMYVRAVRSDEAHLARSVTVPAVALGYDEDSGEDGFRLERLVPGVPREVRIVTLDYYDAGEAVTLRVDPTDVGWTHPVAEPPDRTWWVSLAVGAGLLALVLGVRLVDGRVRRRALAVSQARRGLPVRYLAADRVTYVACTDEDVVVALLEVEGSHGRPAGTTSVGPLLRRGWLVGDVRPGGWAAVASWEDSLLPMTPLQALPDLPAVDDASVDPDLDDDDDDDELEDLENWTDPVPSHVAPAPLPVMLRPDPAEVVVGAALVVVAVTAGWWALGWDEARDEGWLVILFVAGNLVVFGLARVVGRVVVDHAAITSREVVFEETVAMRDVIGVRVGDGHLYVETDDDIIEIGPFSDGDPGVVDRVLSRGSWRRLPTAAEVGAAVERARRTSSVSGPTGGKRLSWGVLPLAACIVLAAVRLSQLYL